MIQNLPCSTPVRLILLAVVIRGGVDQGKAAELETSVVTIRSSYVHDESAPLLSSRLNLSSEDVPQLAEKEPSGETTGVIRRTPERSVLVARRVRHANDSITGEMDEPTFLAQTLQQQPDVADRAESFPGASVEQTRMGTGPAPTLVASFDGLGAGFEGPQGTARFRNPSDNSLAVGPNHIVQIVNSRMAIFTKMGAKFDTTGRVLYGPVETRNVFRGCGECGEINNGDAVVRYDQLADRWLIVMPIFRRIAPRETPPATPQAGDPASLSMPGVEGQPGDAVRLFQPPPDGEETGRSRRRRRQRNAEGSYAMCYAISTTSDPLGSYYRYEFLRPLFPDYPRPAVWNDGYYVPTSTGDNIIQKHMCVVQRDKMLRGEDATEQIMVIDNVNFLNNADIDGFRTPPKGAPNIMMATGGAQLKGDLDDDGIYYWKVHVDWEDSSNTRLEGPAKIEVAPYEYLCGGQLSRCVPQPGTGRRLDSQGDKIMARLVYRKFADRESIVAVHSVGTSSKGGGVRWYEFRLDADRNPTLHQQGTYAPGGNYRWMASPAIDALGNISIGYSFGGAQHFPGQRFAGRRAGDPIGELTLKEAVLAEGQAAQTNTLRWMDYTQTAIDPDDDCTIWYVGDYIKKGASSYSSRIGAFRLPGCGTAEDDNDDSP